ncbi:phospholipid scramblase 1-like [Clavelina lepadiformis]|uniref:phospholipid scramblase 1-like n=1 Tax=Clavelina lepadiformis TaxID=159417 RepID=UPI0040425AC7
MAANRNQILPTPSGFDTTQFGGQSQPAQNQWMAMPSNVPGCPPGLEYLSQLDQLLVHQQVELFEALTSVETKNKYAIKNGAGQQCYYAYEESDLCMRICCKSNRGFMMHIVDNAGQEVIRLNRPFKCCAGCCWCANSDGCAFTIDVEAPVGTVIGQIRQSQSFWKPHYDIIDDMGKTIFKIKGPCCVCQGICCSCEFPFDIYPGDYTQAPVGKIAKQWSGFAKEMFTNATNFSVQFPVDLSVKMKAVLLGATFLIDFMFFEHQNE